jgi:hypothetical protein
MSVRSRRTHLSGDTRQRRGDRHAPSGLVLIVSLGISLATPASGWSQTRQPRKQSDAAVASKPWTPPLTPFGQPDLQGVWRNNSATPLERPAALAGRASLTDEEVAELRRRAERIFKEGNSAFAVGDAVFLSAFSNLDRYENPNSTASSVWMVPKEFENRTSLVVDPSDGRIPALTSEAQQRQAADAARQRRLAGSEDLNNALRCLTYGVPRFGGRYGEVDFGYFEILQEPEYVVLRMEAVHETRVIPVDGRPHLSQRLPQWTGDSRGRWDGATLVVDTTNFSPKSNFMGAADRLHLIERFTRVAPDAIRYEVTLDDSTTWTKPWTVSIRLKRTEDQLFEFACHEGNLSMLGILNGARADEKAVDATHEGR